MESLDSCLRQLTSKIRLFPALESSGGGAIRLERVVKYCELHFLRALLKRGVALLVSQDSDTNQHEAKIAYKRNRM
jgi:hypothetical protein